MMEYPVANLLSFSAADRDYVTQRTSNSIFYVKSIVFTSASVNDTVTFIL